MHSEERRAWLARAWRGLLAVGFLGAGSYAATQPAERVVRITAKKFEFVPPEITVKRGEPVLLELTTPDGLMGFKCPALGLRMDIVPDKVTEVRLVADKVGKIAFYCDVFCGDGHEDMDGTITVVD